MLRGHAFGESFSGEFDWACHRRSREEKELVEVSPDRERLVRSILI